MRSARLLILLVIAVGTLSGFTSCSSGSGSDNQTNVNSGNQQGGAGLTYSGPPPSTSDVQAFQTNVWNNLVGENRCGTCHKQGGTGQFAFVRDDDINAAYETVNNNSLVDLSVPGNSRLVTKVAGGHNCWLSDPNACGDIITGWITDWATIAGGIANTITLTAPGFNLVQDSRQFPSDSNGFRTHVWEPVLRRDSMGPAEEGQYCSRCHSEGADNPQAPFFASSDIDVAYSAARSKINLDDPASSRFVVRLRNEFHNCWSNCLQNAQTMEDAIAAYAATIDVVPVDPDLLTSGAVTLTGDGIVASTGGRIENNVIALYTFKPPATDSAGTTIDQVFDVSGVSPAADLRRFGSGVSWVGAWGATITSGRLQSTGSGSQKLYDLISLTGEYSIEAWVAPANVVQDNAARIVSYSGNATLRNFTLGQSTYNYDFLNRSSVTDQDGRPALSTPDADEVLQATLQHVAVTYDPIDGRKIYVNGEEVAGMADPQGGGTLSNWDNSYVLSLGAEVDGDSQWQGTIRLLAIHNRALPLEDIQNNYDVGVGEKFFLLFDLSNAGLVSMPQAYIAFEVEQFDNYGYLFKNPFFISLSSSATPDDIVIRGMRIGMNGRELIQGQAYAKLDTTITEASYTEGGQLLSSYGTIIPLGNGPDFDQFFLTFDQIGNNTYTRTQPATPSWPAPEIAAAAQPQIGVRHFEEINAAMSAATTIDRARVFTTYNRIYQQLPQVEAIDGFLPAHQMAVTQLAVDYCDQLATDTTVRASYFPAFGGSNWNTDASAAFDTAARSAIIDPLLASLAAHTVPADGGMPADHLDTQPDPATSNAELNDLIDVLIANGADTEEVVTGVCTAAMGSALLMIQ